jgi:hypothetical protein
MPKVMRFRRQLQLAGRAVIAVDVFLANQTLDRIDRIRKRAVAGARPLHPQLRNQRDEILRDAGIDLAAVAPGRAAANAPRVKHRHRGAALAQRLRRRQAGEATTDHGDIGLALDRTFTRRNERRCGIEPIGIELHPVCP